MSDKFVQGGPLKAGAGSDGSGFLAGGAGGGGGLGGEVLTGTVNAGGSMTKKFSTIDTTTKERDELRQQVEQLTQRAEKAECERDENYFDFLKVLSTGVVLGNKESRLKNALLKRDREQQIKALNGFAEHVKGDDWEDDDLQMTIKSAIEQLLKQEEHNE